MTEPKYGVATCSIIPVRKEPDERSEMTSQVLFGELFLIKEQSIKWSKVTLADDNYYGWIDNKMFTVIDTDTFNMLYQNHKTILKSSHTVYTPNDQKMFLVQGSSVPFELSEFYFTFNDKFYRLDKPINVTDKDLTGASIVKTSLEYINAPYLWGGKTKYGIDCSGLVQMIYKQHGIFMPRDTSKQVDIGKTISFVESAKHGDIAFFDNEEGNIVHVGILLNNKSIIHASGCVRIDSFDHQGIFNKERDTYTHKLRIIKRLF